jgi:hypothetical protein
LVRVDYNRYSVPAVFAGKVVSVRKSSEGFGLNLIWTRQQPIESFIGQILAGGHDAPHSCLCRRRQLLWSRRLTRALQAQGMIVSSAIGLFCGRLICRRGASFLSAG